MEDRPCDVHESKIERLEKETEEQWTAINKLRDRLPNWAVFLIAGLSGALGWALQWGATAARIAAAAGK